LSGNTGEGVKGKARERKKRRKGEEEKERREGVNE
jgi:hypothetical protein